MQTPLQKPSSALQTKEVPGQMSYWRDLLADSNQPVKSLVIGPETDEWRTIAAALKKCGASVVLEHAGPKILESMRSTQFDVIFAAPDIPGLEGNKLLAAAKENNPEAEVFVIVPVENLSGGVEFLRRGAEGFLLKSELAAQLQVTVRKVRDRKQLKRLAYTDGLTSLFNQTMFQHFLMHEFNRCSRNGHSFAVLIMDIDDFKTYNDLNGHLLGDIALIKIGKLLKENTRSSDVPARYGGDEFAAMLTEIGAREAFLRANRLRHLVTLSPFQYEKNMPGKKLTISAGVALFPDHGANHIELLKNADKALYQAKNEGRNRICVCRN